MTPQSYRHPYSWWQKQLDPDGRQKTADGFKNRCPAHDDDGPSLHVTRKGTDAAPPVLHCFAGCSYQDIERATREGTPADEPPAGPRVTRHKAVTRPEKDPPGASDPLTWLSDYLGGIPVSFLQTLPLRAVGDQVHYTFPHNGIAKTRLASDTVKRPGWNKAGVFTPLLWPAPTDNMPAKIYLTEGETDCVVLRYQGYDAYAITHGAKATLPPGAYRDLKAHGVEHIVLAFDQDSSGEAAREEYASDIIAAGLVVSTLRVSLRIFEGEKDIRDWFLRTKGKEPLVDEQESVALDLDALAAASPPDTRWVAPGFFAHDAITLVAGPPKAGKSTLVYLFLACHEKAGTFLGTPATRGRALLMSEEFAPTILEKTQAFGIEDIAVLTQGAAATQGWTFTEALVRAVAQARQEKRDVLVIDTLSAWAQFKDENDASEVTQALTAIRNTVAGTGIAVILIHHTRKGGGEHGEAIRGSSALYALTEIAIEYGYKDKTTRGVSVSSRFADVPEPLFVRMTERGHLEVLDQAEWNVEEASPVIDALTDGPKDVRQLLAATELSEPTIRKHLHHLEALGKVSYTVGARGRKTYTMPDNGRAGGAIFKAHIRTSNASTRPQRPALRVMRTPPSAQA